MSPEPDLRPDKRIDEYVLIERLSSYSHVWHAFDEGAQREVVLKFVSDRTSATREGTILADIDHPNILKLLRKFQHEGVAVLVFEYVPGKRLDKAIRDGVSRENSFRICMDVCSALSEIHTYGLFHGDLSPFNVIWSSDKGKAFLIDFGAMGGCTVLSAAPEHDPNNADSIGPHTDIVGLGRILMLMLPGMKSVYEKCLYDEIHLRPTAGHVFKVLKKARDRRKVYLRTTVSLLTLLLVGLLSAYWREPTKDEIINKLARSANAENIAVLRGFMLNPEYADFREKIVKTISDHNEALGKDAVIVRNLDDYVAVFALEKNPVIILEQGYLQLGDRAVIGGEAGFIQEINRGNIILRTSNGSKEISYPKPLVFGRGSQYFYPINVMPGKDNFLKILRILAPIHGYTLQEKGQVDGRIAGSFNVPDFESFLKKLLGHVKVHGYNIAVQESVIPRSVISAEPYWVFRNLKLSEFLAKYEPFIGYTLRYEATTDPTDFYYPVMQFHDLIDEMELKIYLEGQTIIVREGDSQ